MPVDKGSMFFFYKRVDPNVTKGIAAASPEYTASLVMVKGAAGGYYVAVTSEEAAKTVAEASGWDGYVRGDNISPKVWHDFSRSKAICLSTPEDVSNFLQDHSKVDFERLADWVR